MAQTKTDIKKPLDLAIQRQLAINAAIKVDKNLEDVQNVLKQIGATLPSTPTKPAS